MRYIKQKKYFIIIITICLIFLFVLIYNNPIRIIESKIKLKIPKNSKIIVYERDIFDGFKYVDNVYIKVKISNEEKEEIIEQLEDENIFPKYNTKVSFDNMTHFNNVYDWFSFKEENIVNLYCSYRTDKQFNDKHTHDIWIIITSEEDDNYLYIAF